MKNRICVIGIVIKDRKTTAELINKILSDFGEIVVGRLGIPYREKKISVISVIVDGTNDQIGALTGKLGQVKNVKVKSAILI